MERYIAIDNVCAWPNLTLLPNGDIVATIFNQTTDGGYPASVELDDGTLVTAYYCNRTPAHHRYHVGVLRWRLDEK